ncbi:hypothetical protein CBQ28_13935 [Pseudoalteromonas sp. GCY]|uniref:hypothetical protein n=1 Tax=Pseudoalteromonas sp. GCY TaxID=2003316 RepID=UPI000BFEF279|nr:hypothetical protein [Pseudoalteromonas sp. GCY]PHI36524.1 hypothetical protein CBQ28_13935 [Pseudoalteromonas sp. GCY]QQQ67836.1 hypothetical protein JJQ94_08480 [Pseudoalteromonas sp. GCY]
MIIKPRQPAGFFVGAIWSQTLDDETPRVAAPLFREETHRSSGLYVAKKHIVAATLGREKTHRSSDFKSPRNTS